MQSYYILVSYIHLNDDNGNKSVILSKLLLHHSVNELCHWGELSLLDQIKFMDKINEMLE